METMRSKVNELRTALTAGTVSRRSIDFALSLESALLGQILHLTLSILTNCVSPNCIFSELQYILYPKLSYWTLTIRSEYT